MDLPHDVPIDGTLGTRLLPDKTVVTLAPLVYGDSQVTIAPPHPVTGEPDLAGWSQAYQFDEAHFGNALVSFLTYGPDLPEPEGWNRHIPSNRRRPGGDASAEYINP